MIEHCKNLDALWTCVAKINKQHFPDNKLMPILGGGKTFRPKVMFVFINPTARNQSANPTWNGPRFPFLGTKQIWRVFHKAGLFDDALMQKIEHNSIWTVDLARAVLHFLQQQQFYLTNIVKWTGHDATLPDAQKLELFLPILKKEIELVQPEYIFTFGLIPFVGLTKQKITLSEYYSRIMRKQKLEAYSLALGMKSTKVIPCYFPVGRGDPKKAVEILRLLRTTLFHSQPL